MCNIVYNIINHSISNRVWHFTWFEWQSETPNIAWVATKHEKMQLKPIFTVYILTQGIAMFSFPFRFRLRALSLSHSATHTLFPLRLLFSSFFRGIYFLSSALAKEKATTTTGEWNLFLCMPVYASVANIRNTWFHSHAQNTHFPFFVSLNVFRFSLHILFTRCLLSKCALVVQTHSENQITQQQHDLSLWFCYVYNTEILRILYKDPLDRETHTRTQSWYRLRCRWCVGKWIQNEQTEKKKKCYQCKRSVIII